MDFSWLGWLPTMKASRYPKHTLPTTDDCFSFSCCCCHCHNSSLNKLSRTIDTFIRLPCRLSSNPFMMPSLTLSLPFLYLGYLLWQRNLSKNETKFERKNFPCDLFQNHEVWLCACLYSYNCSDEVLQGSIGVSCQFIVLPALHPTANLRIDMIFFNSIYT